MLKKVLLTATLMVLVFSGLTDARLCSNKQGISSNFKYKNKQYKSILLYCGLDKSSNIDINSSEIPKKISEIISIGKKTLKKVDSDQVWELQSLNLNKYNYQNSTYWYYQLNFNANNQFYVYINIGLNGETPDIYRIDEVLLENTKN